MKYNYFGSYEAADQSIECIGRIVLGYDHVSFDDMVQISDIIANNEAMWEKADYLIPVDVRLSFVREAFMKAFQHPDHKGIVNFYQGSVQLNLQSISDKMIYYSITFKSVQEGDCNG